MLRILLTNWSTYLYLFALVAALVVSGWPARRRADPPKENLSARSDVPSAAPPFHDSGCWKMTGRPPP